MTKYRSTTQQDALNRRYRELENQLVAAFPAQRDEIEYEMQEIERRLRELATSSGGRDRQGRRS